MSAQPKRSLTIVEPRALAEVAAIADLYPSKSAEEQRQMVERHLRPEFAASRANQRTILFARRDDILVGTVQIVWRDESAEPGLLQPGSAVIHHLRTHPDHRQIGIGRRLLAAAEHLAMERDVTALTLGVEPSNTIARNLYETFGFHAFLTYLGSDGELLIGMKKPLVNATQRRIAMEPATSNTPPDWHQERALLGRRVQELREQGICDTCHNLATGEPYGRAFLLYEDDRFLVNLEAFPRTGATRSWSTSHTGRISPSLTRTRRARSSGSASG